MSSINPMRVCMGCTKELSEGAHLCSHCGWDNGVNKNEPHQLPIHSILNGKYLVGRALGQGGFGITYIGWDINLEVKVAIKEYYPEGCVSRGQTAQTTVRPFTGQAGSLFEAGREKFVSEARALAKFSGESSIVSVKDFFRENGTAYIVMEFVEGCTLKDYVALKGGKLQVSETLRLMRPLVLALQNVHEAGLLHRDISPDNIMLMAEGGVKLLDFGAAREMSIAGEHSNTVNVKHGYAPEEQYRTRGEQGPWTDVYALAATIYRITTGVTPPQSLERMAGEAELLSPIQAGADFTKKQSAAILKALSVRAKDRFQSMQEFAAALYDGVPVSETVTAQNAPAKPGFLQELKTNRRFAAIAAAVGGMVVLAVVLMLVFIKPDEKGLKSPKEEPGQPAGAAVAAGSLCLPDPAAFHNTELIAGEKDGRATYVYDPVTASDLFNYYELLQANNTLKVALAGDDEAHLLEITGEGGSAATLTVSDEGIAMIAPLGDTAIAFEEPPVTAAYLNNNGISAKRWAELGVEYNERGLNYAGTIPGNVANGPFFAVEGDNMYVAGPSSGEVIRIPANGEAETILNMGKKVRYLNAVGNSLYFCAMPFEGEGNWDLYVLPLGEKDAKPVKLRDEAFSCLVMGEWIYFINFQSSDLYRMKRDGSGEQVVVANEGDSFAVTDELVVFTGNDKRIYACDPDGGNKRLLVDTKTYAVTLYGEWVYYVEGSGTNEVLKRYSLATETLETLDEGQNYMQLVADANHIYYYNSRVNTLCSLKIGTDETILIGEDDERVPQPVTMPARGIEWVFFTNGKFTDLLFYDEGDGTTTALTNSGESPSAPPADGAAGTTAAARGNVPGNAANGGLAAIDSLGFTIYANRASDYHLFLLNEMDKPQVKMNAQSAWNINYYEAAGYIYFTNEDDGNKIYRMRPDPTDKPQKLNEVASTSVSVVGKYVYYIDATDSTVHRMDLDGGNDTKLFFDRAKELCVGDGYLAFINMSRDDLPYAALLDELTPVPAGEDAVMELCIDGDYILAVPKEGNGGVYGVNVWNSEAFWYGVELNTALNAANGYVYYYRNAALGNDEDGIYRAKLGQGDVPWPDEEFVCGAKDAWNINITDKFMFYRVEAHRAADQAMYVYSFEDGSSFKIG